MIQKLAKKHIVNLERFKNPTQPRASFLRLDKNENIIGFDQDAIRLFRDQINSDFLTAYPELPPLYKKIAGFLGCQEDNLYLTAGSDAAIKAVFEVFVEKGDTVALLHPTYAMYYVYTDMFQGNLVKINYRKDLSLAEEDIIRVISRHKPKLVCLANPNSPTGTVISPEDMERIMKACADTIVLVDEAYHPFYPISSISLIQRYPNLVVTRTFSKAAGLASARLGFAAGQKQIIDYLHKVRPVYEVNAFAVKFAEIILNNYQLVEKALKQIKSGKEYLYNELDKLNVPYHKSYANFVLINVGSFERSVKIGRELYKKGILIKSGFDDGLLDNYIRVSLASPKQMKIFVEAFKKILDNE